MRLVALFLLLVLTGCSRSPSPADKYTAAWTAFRQGNLSLAQKLAGVASSQQSPLDQITLLRVEILLAQGKFPTALAILNKLPDSSDPGLHLRLLVDRAEALWKTSHEDQAMGLLDQIERAAPNSRTEVALKAALLRTAIWIPAGQFGDAEKLLQNILTRATEAGDSFNQAAAILNISRLKLAQERYDESLAYSRSARQTAEKAKAGRLAAMASNNLGIAYTGLGDLSQAEAQQTKAIAQLREIGDQRNLEDSLGGMGNIHLLDGHPERAEAFFKEAVAIASTSGFSEEAARWAGQLALALIRQQRWGEADTWNKKARSFLGAEPTPQHWYLRSNDAEIADGMGRTQDAIQQFQALMSKTQDLPYLSWNTHVQLAALLAKTEKFTEAKAEYEQGLTVIERLRTNFPNPDARIRYQDQKMKVFKDYVELLAAHGWPERALQVAEYSRARALAEKLGQESKTINEVHPQALIEYARRTGEVILSYWLAPQRSFVWVVSGSGIHRESLPPEKEIADLVRGYRKAIEQDLRDPVAESVPQGVRLRDILLGPVYNPARQSGDPALVSRTHLTTARRVVVVPDGALHALNFETLPAFKTGYWIEEQEVSVTPSMSVLTDNARPQSLGSSLLLIGASVSPNRDYPALLGAQAEIDAIEARPGYARKVVRAGQQATPYSFFDAKPEQFSTIHFAAHAEANPQSPLDSAIILSPDSGGYKLYARDIAAVKLSAGLVTISACQSAGARSYAGEGPVGLAWAFLQSGAHSVIAGLWDVSDAASTKLMDKLYEGLSKGQRPAAALREAKLALLHSGKTGDKPFYWAPYQVYIR